MIGIQINSFESSSFNYKLNKTIKIIEMHNSVQLKCIVMIIAKNYDERYAYSSIGRYIQIIF